MNTMDINGYQAAISYDPNINQFRGEFIELNGGADFYAADVDALRQEGTISLRVFLKMCRVNGIEPRRSFFWKIQCTNSTGTSRTSCSGSGLQQQKFECGTGGEIGGMRWDGFNVNLAPCLLPLTRTCMRRSGWPKGTRSSKAVKLNLAVCWVSKPRIQFTENLVAVSDLSLPEFPLPARGGEFLTNLLNVNLRINLHGPTQQESI